MSPTCTVRDLDIVDTLTRRVRLLTFSQIKRIWWSHLASDRMVRQRLTWLVRGRLLHRTVVNLRCLPVRQPLCVWQLGQREPDFERLSALARDRWPTAAEPTTAFWATKQAANLFGSTANKFSQLEHRDHDVLLAEVYVWYRSERPQAAQRWCGTDALPKAGFPIKDPDAFLMADDGRPLRVIQSAGHSSVQQIARFHEHCREYDLPYELW